MSTPTVCAVMLTANRPEMARRAIQCFVRQTYENKQLLICNSGPGFETGIADEDNIIRLYVPLESLISSGNLPPKIGGIRNLAALLTAAPIIVNWDDDDYSHPKRIEEQVSLLLASGADAVGYRDCLFWDTRNVRHERQLLETTEMGLLGGAQSGVRSFEPGPIATFGGEAWFYCAEPLDRTQVLGSSLMYWRKTWEQWPFRPDTSSGEEQDLILKCNGNWISSISTMRDAEPRMVCGIHGGPNGNTSNYSLEHLRSSREWSRRPQFDSLCERIMKL